MMLSSALRTATGRASALRTPAVRNLYTEHQTFGKIVIGQPIAKVVNKNVFKKPLFGAVPKRNIVQSAGIAVENATARIGGKLSKNQNLALGILGGVGLAGLHSATGSSNDFYEYRFKTEKSADDLASFFGGEEFMELFCIFPLVGVLMMRMGYFDDEGNVITQGVPGTLKVSMVFSDEPNDNTGETDWFNKRERFRNICLGHDCWDMVTNFGFRTLEDGSREVYLAGEYFHGNLPVVSQIMRLVFTVHARWLAWSTEHHINHFAFTAGNEREEHMEEESRHNMPLFLLKNYAFSDLVAMIFGYDLNKSTSFLVLKASMVGKSEEEDEDEDEMEEEDEEEEEEVVIAAPILSVQNHRTLLKRRASIDIEFDRESAKQLIARHHSISPNDNSPEAMKVVLARRATMRKGAGEELSAYDLAREAAKERFVVRRATLQARKDMEELVSLKRRMTIQDKKLNFMKDGPSMEEVAAAEEATNVVEAVVTKVEEPVAAPKRKNTIATSVVEAVSAVTTPVTDQKIDL